LGQRKARGKKTSRKKKKGPPTVAWEKSRDRNTTRARKGKINPFCWGRKEKGKRGRGEGNCNRTKNGGKLGKA